MSAVGPAQQCSDHAGRRRCLGRAAAGGRPAGDDDDCGDAMLCWTTQCTGYQAPVTFCAYAAASLGASGPTAAV